MSSSDVMTFPTLTKKWHNATYPAISPTHPSHSVAGKTVFITGGGTGIGARTTHAFAAAGAAVIAISGRTEKTLLATKKDVEATYNTVKVLTFVADVTNEEAVNGAFATVGKVDILVANAGYLPDFSVIAQSKLSEWWSGFDINVRGSFIVTQAFLKVAPSTATIVNVSTAMKDFPAFPGFSAYAASKMAQAKFFDYVQAENPDLHVVHIHPGTVQTDMAKKGDDAGLNIAKDDVELPASFIVWVCSPEARFAKGKLLWSNWDVEELMARADEIKNGPLLTMGLEGMSSFKYTSGSS